jgi:hypothetical protein
MEIQALIVSALEHCDRKNAMFFLSRPITICPVARQQAQFACG